MTTPFAALIESYLEGQISDQEAAQRLVDMVETTASDSAIDEESYRSFEAIIAATRRLPENSPRLDRMVVLLRTLKSTSSSLRDWSELNPLGMLIRELWNIAGPGDESWLTINAFAARLADANILDLDIFAIWAMRSALEADECEVKLQESKIAAASMWLKYAGQRMYKLSLERAKGSQATRGGSNWKGEAGYSMQRWDFWKERLRAIKAGDKDEQGCKDVADEALQAMDKAQG